MTTRAGVGSSHHRDPRQAGRADLYACGVVLYESLVGVRPFVAPTPYTLIAAMLSEQPREVAEALEALA